MPVSKAGSPTKMVQQSGKPPVAATEAENQNKITNEHIKEQDKKEVSCQSEILDPHEDEDEDQEHNTPTPRGTGKQSYIGEWISASIEKSYRPGTRQVIDRLRGTNLASTITVTDDPCEPRSQKPHSALQSHRYPTSGTPSSAITTSTPDRFVYVPPSHDDLDVRAENFRLRKKLADKEHETVDAEIQANELRRQLEDAKRSLALEIGYGAQSGYWEVRARKSEDKWRHHREWRERKLDEIEKEKARNKQQQEQNKKERVMIEKEEELLAFRIEEAERSLAKAEAGS